MEKWRRRFREAIITSSRVPGFRTLLRRTCQVITWEVGREITGIPGVAAVYTRHSHPRFPTFAPGESDLDLTVVMNDDAVRDANIVRACADKIDSLNRKFPFVFPQDARFITHSELAQIEAAPGTAEILGSPDAWIMIGGRDARHNHQVSVLPLTPLPWHPEFNAWWLNVMQTHVLTPQVNLAENNLRLCFRVAAKNQLNLQVARGLASPPTEPYLSDSAASSLFANDPEMSAVLGDLARNRFWARDGESRKSKILQRSLALAAEFYHSLPVPSESARVASVAERSPAIPEAHRQELQERLIKEEAISAIVESVIVYPTPHWSPREYQIDLILKDETSPTAFDKAVRVIRNSFQGRTFGIGGTHAQFTMVPRSAFEHPWFSLGTPSPFLYEHLANFAESLMGAPPRIPAAPSRAERLRWCGQYFLFHRFTLHFRPGYASKDCNFCQLAALRLFLEHDLILTDASQVRDAYTNAFVKSREASSAIDLLMRPDGKRFDEKTFATVLQLQSREYAEVEALLRQHSVLP